MPQGSVVVTFTRRRRVFVDNQPMGETGDALLLQTGFHDFDLGSPADYTPAMQTVNVVSNLPANPMIVAFSPLVMNLPPVGASRSKTAGKAGVKSRKKTAKKSKALRQKTTKKKVLRKKAAKKRKPGR